MCEYSLEAAKTEQARQGETYKMGSIGRHPAFVTDATCRTAACMPEGTRLRLEGISYGVQRKFCIPSSIEGVMVREPVKSLLGGTLLDPNTPHYDAVRFENGQTMRLGYLAYDRCATSGNWIPYEGAQATVLMLGNVTAPEDVDLAGPPPPQYTGTPIRGDVLSIGDFRRLFMTA